MVCHRTLQARAVRPPQRRWSKLPPHAGSELAAGGARAAKRMGLRRCSAVAVRPPRPVASWSTRGAVSVKASNSGGDYLQSRPGSTTFLTVGFMEDDDYESSPHVDEAGHWHFVGLRRCRRRPSARTRSPRGHDELKSTIFNHAAAMTCPVDLRRPAGLSKWQSKMMWQWGIWTLRKRRVLGAVLRASWHAIMHNVWSHSNGLTLSERGFPPYAAPNVGMVQILRLVKTQCSCASAFSSELWPWIGSSLKYDCSLVIRGSVRFHIQSFLKITT